MNAAVVVLIIAVILLILGALAVLNASGAVTTAPPIAHP